MPVAYADRRIHVFETGGSTGVPKFRINIDDCRLDYEEFSRTLPEHGFPRASDWLQVGPSGPRRLRLAIEHLAQHRGGVCFMVDLDPRFVVKLLKAGAADLAKTYRDHVVDQALTLLRAHDSIRCLFTLPSCSKRSARRSRCARPASLASFGGTEMTPQFHRFAVEQLLEGVEFVPTYGNTLKL